MQKRTNSARPDNAGLLVAGRIPVLECLRAKKRNARRLLYLPSATGLEEIREAARGVDAEPRDRNALDQLTGGVPHQGVVLQADPLPLLPLEGWMKKHAAAASQCAVLLDGIEDPHNFGAIVRSATAFGATGILFGKDRAAPLSVAALKSAAGAMEHIDLVEIANLARAMSVMKEAGFWTSGLDAAGDRLLWQGDLRGKCLLIIGGEGKGIRRIVLEGCDFVLRIPIEGAITSLNASVSAAVALAEWKRQNT